MIEERHRIRTYDKNVQSWHSHITLPKNPNSLRKGIQNLCWFTTPQGSLDGLWETTKEALQQSESCWNDRNTSCKNFWVRTLLNNLASQAWCTVFDRLRTEKLSEKVASDCAYAAREHLLDELSSLCASENCRVKFIVEHHRASPHHVNLIDYYARKAEVPEINLWIHQASCDDNDALLELRFSCTVERNRFAETILGDIPRHPANYPSGPVHNWNLLLDNAFLESGKIWQADDHPESLLVNTQDLTSLGYIVDIVEALRAWPKFPKDIYSDIAIVPTVQSSTLALWHKGASVREFQQSVYYYQRVRVVALSDRGLKVVKHLANKLGDHLGCLTNFEKKDEVWGPSFKIAEILFSEQK